MEPNFLSDWMADIDTDPHVAGWPNKKFVNFSKVLNFLKRPFHIFISAHFNNLYKYFFGHFQPQKREIFRRNILMSYN